MANAESQLNPDATTRDSSSDDLGEAPYSGFAPSARGTLTSGFGTLPISTAPPSTDTIDSEWDGADHSDTDPAPPALSLSVEPSTRTEPVDRARLTEPDLYDPEFPPDPALPSELWAVSARAMAVPGPTIAAAPATAAPPAEHDLPFAHHQAALATPKRSIVLWIGAAIVAALVLSVWLRLLP